MDNGLFPCCGYCEKYCSKLGNSLRTRFQLFCSMYPEMKLLDYVIVLFLIFWRTFIMCFITFPPNVRRVLMSPLPRQHLLSSVLLTIAILTGERGHLNVVLNCMSLMIDHLCVHPLAICMSSLEKCLFKSFAYCLIGIFGIFAMSYSYVLEINPLSDIWVAFLPTHRLSFYSVDWFLCCSQPFSVMSSFLYIFALVAFGFGVCYPIMYLLRR